MHLSNATIPIGGNTSITLHHDIERIYHVEDPQDPSNEHIYEVEDLG